jgi:hypothetical protein
VIAHSSMLVLAVIACSCALTLVLLSALIVIACSYTLVMIACRYVLVVYIIIYSHAITITFSVCCRAIAYSCGLIMIICGCMIGSDFSCSSSCDI